MERQQTPTASGRAGDKRSDADAEHAGQSEEWRRALATTDDLGALFPPQFRPLFRYFYHQIGDMHDAEDLLATTVSKALASIGRFDPGRGEFVVWLFSIARHTLYDFRRRMRTHADIAVLNPPLRDPAPSLDILILKAEEALLLHARVRQLPPGQREVITLYYFGGLKAMEIASVIGRSEGAVRLLIHRALTALRDQYQREEQA